jgi:hypothetical protein
LSLTFQTKVSTPTRKRVSPKSAENGHSHIPKTPTKTFRQVLHQLPFAGSRTQGREWPAVAFDIVS